MPALEFTIADFTLNSTWVVYYDARYGNIMESQPTTAEVSKTVSFTGIPAGSTINSAILTATLGSPLTGAAIRSVNDAAFNGSLEVGAVAGGSKSYTFKFKAVGNTSTVGNRSSSQTFTNVKITVTYTLPYTAFTAPTSVLLDSNASVNKAPGSTATLSWSGVGGGTNLTVSKYEIYRSTSSATTGYSLYTSTTSTSASVPNSTVGNVTYYYKVKVIASLAGYDSDQSSEYATFSAPTSAPTAPSAPAISGSKPAPPSASRELSWTASTNGTNNAVSGYDIYRKLNTGSYSKLSSVAASATKLTITTAGNGDTYTYYIVATAPHGNSANSAEVSVKSEYTNVGTPTGLSVSPTTVDPSGAAQLSWNAVANGTNNNVVSYKITRSTTVNGTYSPLSDVLAGSTTLAVTGSADYGGTFFYKVATVGERNTSAASSAVQLTSGSRTAFVAPTLSINNANVLPGGSATLSWGNPTGGKYLTVSKYEIYRSSTSSTSGFSLLGNTTSKTYSVTAHSTPNTTYWYAVKVIASTSGYDSGLSNGVALNTPIGAATAPTTISINTPTTVGPNIAKTLTWSGGSVGSNDTFSHYDIHRSTSASTGFASIGTATGTTLAITSSGTNGTTFYYKVITVGTYRSSALSTASASLLTSFEAPSVPTGLALSANNIDPGGSSRLSWSAATAGTNNSVVGYTVSRSTSLAGSYTDISNPTTTYLDVTGTSTHGTSYFYKVKTRGSFSHSAYSSPIELKTVPYTAFTAPTSVLLDSSASVNKAPGSTATLSWSGVGGGINLSVSKYEIYRSTSSATTGYALYTSTTSTSASVPNSTVGNVTHYYKVKVIANLAGYDSGQSSAYATFGAPTSAPTAPGAPTISGTAPAPPSTTRALSWTASTGGSNNTFTGYDIYRSVNTGAYSKLASVAANVTSVDVTTAAANGDTHTYYVVAVAPHGNSANSATASIKTEFSNVNIPTGFKVTPTAVDPSGSAALSWTIPSGGTNNPVTGFEITRSTTANGTYALLTSPIATASSSTVTGSADYGGTFFYKIRALGALGNSDYTAAVQLTSGSRTAFVAPTLSINNANVLPGGSATLSWGDPTGGKYLTVSKYEIYRSSTSATSGFALLGSTTSKSYGVTAHSTPNTTYWYAVKVIANVANYDSGLSNGVALNTPIGAATAPTTVSINTPTTVGPNVGKTLTWSGGSVGSNDTFKHYDIHRSTNASTGFASIGTSATTTLAITSSGTNGTTFYYKVITVGTYRSSALSTASASLLTSFDAPSVPTGLALSVNNIAPSGVSRLSWGAATAGSNNSVTGYTVSRSTSLSGDYTDISNPTTTYLDVTGTSTNGTSYFYKVKTRGSLGDSAYSSAIELKTVVGAITAPGTFRINTLTAVTLSPGSTASLTWTASANGTNNNIQNYKVYSASTATGSYTLIATLASSAESYTVTAPTSVSTTYYKVSAVGTYTESSMSSYVSLAVSLTTGDASQFTLSPASVNAGASTTVTFTTNTAASHVVRIDFGSETTGDISVAAGVTSKAVPIPLDWCTVIPNATSGSATVTVSTYSGSVLKGVRTSSISIVVPSAVVPVVGSFTPTRVNNNVPAAWNVYVVTQSQVQLAMGTATGAQGSTIVSYRLTGGGINTTSATPINVTSGVLSSTSTLFSMTVTDSRGRSATSNITISAEPYSAPSLTYESYRCDSVGNEAVEGKYGSAMATSTFSSVGGKNAITITGRYVERGLSNWTSLGTFTSGVRKVFGSNALALNKYYTVEYTATDTIGSTVVYTDFISSAQYVMHIKSGGDGMAVGGVSDESNVFKLHWRLKTENTEVATNLNADRLDNYHASDFSLAHSHPYLPLSGGTLTGTVTYTSSFQYNAASGGWARGFGYNTNDGSSYIGFLGALGSSDTLTYLTMGTTYNDPKGFRWYPDGTATLNGSQVLHTSNYTSFVTPAGIGAAATSHTHSYLPLSGGTLTGSTTVNGDLTFGATSTSDVSYIYFKNFVTGNDAFIANNAIGSPIVGSYIYFREYSRSSTTGGALSFYETYSLPTSTLDRTTNGGYSILTTKALVSLAQGGTGASTAAGALTNFGLTSTAAELNYCDGVTSNIQTQLNGKAASSHTHTKANITDFPTSMPASDVSAWAKAATKPSYTAAEVGALPSLGGALSETTTAGRTMLGMTAKGTTQATNLLEFRPAESDGYEPYDWGIRITTSGNPRYFRFYATAGTVRVDATGGFSWNGQSLDARYAAASHTHSYAPLTGAGTSGTWGISITGNAATATALATARTLTIGSTGKTFNGSANVSWTLAEIGAAASSHSHSYLPLSGGTLTSTVNVQSTAGSWLSGKTYGAINGLKQSSGSYHPVVRIESYAGNVFNLGGLGESVGFYGFLAARVDNGTDWSFVVNTANGNWTSTGTITASGFIGNASTATTATTAGSCTGNAATATSAGKLTTTRALTIGSTAKNFDGSAAVSWTLAEIGAAASSHTHSYAPLTGAGTSGSWPISVTGSAASATGNAGSATKLATARAINGTNFDGSAAITTANWGTARTLTIGSTGKSVNGSANVSWTLAEIGAAASSHSHSYLPLAGGTLTGATTVPAIAIATKSIRNITAGTGNPSGGVEGDIYIKY